MSELFEKIESQTSWILKSLKDLIELGRKTFYREEYWTQISDEEVLGVIVAKYTEWRGDRIIKTFLEALEDANYHELREQIEQLTSKKLPAPLRGWFCSKCETVYLHPDDDTEHEDLHESVTVVWTE